MWDERNHLDKEVRTSRQGGEDIQKTFGGDIFPLQYITKEYSMSTAKIGEMHKSKNTQQKCKSDPE